MFINRRFDNVIDSFINKDYRKILQIHPLTLQIVKIWDSADGVGKILGLNKSHISKE